MRLVLIPDVFYTNSRYAKVGGLPSHELNQLELQFLLLNDFLLVIPPDEMQRYGDRLLGYWEGKEAETEALANVETKAAVDVKEEARSETPKEEASDSRQEAPPRAQTQTAAPIASVRPQRETSRPSSVSFAETSRPSSMRAWGGGDVRGEVMTGRMTSPMRE